jgi:hypothetical protein
VVTPGYFKFTFWAECAYIAMFFAFLLVPEQSLQFSHVVFLPASSEAGQRTSSVCKDLVFSHNAECPPSKRVGFVF